MYINCSHIAIGQFSAFVFFFYHFNLAVSKFLYSIFFPPLPFIAKMMLYVSEHFFFSISNLPLLKRLRDSICDHLGLLLLYLVARLVGMKAYLVGGCRPSWIQQSAIYSVQTSIFRPDIRNPDQPTSRSNSAPCGKALDVMSLPKTLWKRSRPPSLRSDILFNGRSSYVVERKIDSIKPPSGRMKVSHEFAVTYAQIATPVEREAFWKKSFMEWRDCNSLALLEKSEINSTIFSASNLQMLGNQLDRLRCDPYVTVEGMERIPSKAVTQHKITQDTSFPNHDVGKGALPDKCLKGKRKKASCQSGSDASICTLEPEFIPPPLFYWETTLCGETYYAYMIFPDTLLASTPKPSPSCSEIYSVAQESSCTAKFSHSCVPRCLTETYFPKSSLEARGRPFTFSHPSIFVPLSALSLPFLRLTKHHIFSLRKRECLKKCEIPEEDSWWDQDYTADELEENSPMLLDELETPCSSLDGSPRLQNAAGALTPPKESVPKDTGLQPSFIGSPISVYPLSTVPLTLYWRNVARDKNEKQTPSVLLAPLSECEAVYVMGTGYLVNANDTVLGPLMDTSFCSQFLLPLNETGEVFKEAIKLVHQITKMPFNGFGTNVERDYEGQSHRKGKSRKDFVKRQSFRRSSQYFSSSKGKAGMNLTVEIQPTEVSQERKIDPIWLEKIGSVEKEIVSSGEPEKNIVSASSFTPATHLSNPERGGRRQFQYSFTSPYWIAVDTLEKRWGVTVTQHPSASYLYIHGKRYVNAEHTTDASKFSPATCYPHRIHQYLSFFGIRRCSWECSETLKNLYVKRSRTMKYHNHTRPWEAAENGKKGDEDSKEELCNLWVSLGLIHVAGWHLRDKALLIHIDPDEAAENSGQLKWQPQDLKIQKTSFYDASRCYSEYMYIPDQSSEGCSNTKEVPEESVLSFTEGPKKKLGNRGRGPYRAFLSVSQNTNDVHDELHVTHMSNSLVSSSLSFTNKCFSDPNIFDSFVSQLRMFQEVIVNAADIIESESVMWMLTFAPLIFLRSPQKAWESTQCNKEEKKYDWPAIVQKKQQAGEDSSAHGKEKGDVLPANHIRDIAQSSNRSTTTSERLSEEEECLVWKKNQEKKRKEAFFKEYIEQSRQIHMGLTQKSRILLALFSLFHGYNELEAQKSLAPSSIWFSKQYLKDEPLISVRKSFTTESKGKHCVHSVPKGNRKCSNNAKLSSRSNKTVSAGKSVSVFKSTGDLPPQITITLYESPKLNSRNLESTSFKDGKEKKKKWLTIYYHHQLSIPPQSLPQGLQL